MLKVSLLLLIAALGSAPVASGQEVTKPRSPTDRLPKPPGVTAAQQRDGTILVVWPAMPGALGYKLVRSVPPTGATPLTLPAPSDTQYVDRDVKAGSTYYYVVSAVNGAGIEGLRAGTAPVTGTLTPGATVALREPEPETDPGTEGTAPTTVAPPTGVVARPFPYKTPTVSWQSSVQGARFIVERLDPKVYTSEARKSVWQVVPGREADKAWLCCQMVDRSPPPFGYLRYRVTTIDPAARRSTPTETTGGLSNLAIKTAAPALFAQGMKVGETEQLVGGDRGNTWVSLDTTIVSFHTPGVVQAKSRGTTYVVWTRRNNRDELESLIWRIYVE